MKSLLTIFLLTFCLSTTGFCQKTYKDLKDIYNYNSYIPSPVDPYKPIAAGVTSLFLPGLGQMNVGEVPRGFAFLGASTAGWIINSIGSSIILNDVDPVTGDYTGDGDGTGLFLGGFVIAATAGIWAAIDASRVAKVKNIGYQEREKLGRLDMKLKPSTDSYAPGIRGYGLSLQIGF